MADDARERFEKWATTKRPIPEDIRGFHRGRYMNVSVTAMWESWQAALADAGPGTSQPTTSSPDPFSKGYKHRHGEPVSDACGDGKHYECTQDLTKCHCTYRGFHNDKISPHAYMSVPAQPTRQQARETPATPPLDALLTAEQDFIQSAAKHFNDWDKSRCKDCSEKLFILEARRAENEQFLSRSQEKRIRVMRGDKNPIDPRSPEPPSEEK